MDKVIFCAMIPDMNKASKSLILKNIDTLILQVQDITRARTISPVVGLKLLRDILEIKKLVLANIAQPKINEISTPHKKLLETSSPLTLGKLSSVQTSIMRLLNQFGRMSTNELCAALDDISHRTLRRHIQQLLDSSVVIKSQVGREMFYESFTKN